MRTDLLTLRVWILSEALWEILAQTGSRDHGRRLPEWHSLVASLRLVLDSLGAPGRNGQLLCGVESPWLRLIVHMHVILLTI